VRMSILERLDALKEARRDLRYLLDRGYNKQSALKLVGDRYQLSRVERSILFRSVYSEREVELIRSRRADLSELEGEELWIDGFNVLNTVEAILRGDYIILCDDGVVRDFSEMHSKYRITELTEEAVASIAHLLESARVGLAVVLFEEQVSRSGELAALTRRLMSEIGVKCSARTARAVDSELVRSGKIVATSDSAILLRCRRFIDLPSHLGILKRAKVLSLN